MNNRLILEVYKGTGLKELLDAKNVPSGMMLVEGVFAKVNSLNRNKRYYTNEEYSKHVALMQKRISEENGIFGEMEHPKSMNLNLNNVSHKVTEVRLDEDGFVRGKVLLLDTPSGKIAQSIVRSGSSLPISSRAVGNVLESGEVKLDFMSTFDLVGTAGFTEAGLHECVYECFDESGQLVSEMYEYEIDDAGDVVEASTLKSIVESVEQRLRKSFMSKEDAKTMITESQQDTVTGNPVNVGSLNEAAILALMNQQFTEKYSPIIESWIKQEFAPNFGNVIQEWLANDYANIVESWIKDDVLPHNSEVTENWIKQEFAPKFGEVIQEWFSNDYANIVEAWIKEDVLPHNAEITEAWIKNDVLPHNAAITEAWLENEFKPSLGTINENKTVNENTDTDTQKPAPKTQEQILEEHASVFTSKLLADIDKSINEAKDLKEEPKKEEPRVDETFYQHAPKWLKSIPQEFKPTWQAMNEDQRAQVFRKASIRLLESQDSISRFWKSIDFETLMKKPVSMNRQTQVNENQVDPRKARVIEMAKSLQRK